jgi:hypothetical protein
MAKSTMTGKEMGPGPLQSEIESATLQSMNDFTMSHPSAVHGTLCRATASDEKRKAKATWALCNVVLTLFCFGLWNLARSSEIGPSKQHDVKLNWVASIQRSGPASSRELPEFHFTST